MYLITDQEHQSAAPPTAASPEPTRDNQGTGTDPTGQAETELDPHAQSPVPQIRDAQATGRSFNCSSQAVHQYYYGHLKFGTLCHVLLILKILKILLFCLVDVS